MAPRGIEGLGGEWLAAIDMRFEWLVQSRVSV